MSVHVQQPPFQFELLRRGLRIHNFEGLLGIGTLTGGSTRSAASTAVNLDTGAGAGVAKCAETVENIVAIGHDPTGADTFWSHPQHCSAVVNLTAGTGSDSNCMGGIVLGFAGNAVIPANPASGLIMLMARADTGAWDLISARGNGTAFVRTPLSGVNSAFFFNDSHRLRIEYLPGAAITAIVDGVVGATYSGGAIPQAGSPSAGGGGCRAQIGTGLGDQVTINAALLTVETIGIP